MEKFKNLVLELKNFLQQFDKEKLINNSALSIDWIELSKNIFAQLTRFNVKEKFLLDELKLENFDSAKNYIQFFSLQEVSKDEFNFIVQSLIFSELKGAATLYSKKNYLAKYSIQVLRPEERFYLFYQPKTDQINLMTVNLNNNDKALMLSHRYLVSLEKIKLNKKESPNFIRIGKESKEKVFIDESQFDKLFRLSSSVYQLQFLDRLFYKPRGWENIDIKLSEWNFIVEKEYEIRWNLKTKKPEFVFKENSKKNKLYLAVPFQIKTKTNFHSRLTEIDQNRLNFPILGIDVGEYGLAYCLLTVKNNQQIEVKKTGFILDKNIANIRNKFSQIQQKARQGAFDETDSSVSRVRDNAIGGLRNQIHAILTDGQGSTSIYEYSISNFETGSGRTTKIYNSVKRADVNFENDAIHQHVWGKKTKLVGKELSSYASSYTCAKCCRSLYEINQKDLEEARISIERGNILKIEDKNGLFCVYGYSQDKKYKSDPIYLKNTKESLKEFRKLTTDFARPPVSKNSEVLNNFAPLLLKDSELLEKFEKQRGNSSIFVCPFKDCHYVADADIQAAFMMAIRGYLNFAKLIKPEEIKKTGESYLKETSKLLKKANFSPDNLFYPLINKV